MSLGAASAFLAVLAGAFGAHGLEHVLDERMLKIWQTGVTYQLTHALALVLVGVLEGQRKEKLRTPFWAFAAGTVLFSGSLYALALSGVRALGMITPFGGVAFLCGWVALAWRARSVRSARSTRA